MLFSEYEGEDTYDEKEVEKEFPDFIYFHIGYLYLLVSLSFLMIAWLITHLVPAAIIFPWIFLILQLFIACPEIWKDDETPEEGKEITQKYRSKRRRDRDENRSCCTKLIKPLWYQVMLLITFLCIQTAFNYIVFFYTGENYKVLIKKEWAARDTHCYLENFLDSTRAIFALITYL